MGQVQASIFRSSVATEDGPDTGGNREFGLVRVHPVWEIMFLAEGGLPRDSRGRTGA